VLRGAKIAYSKFNIGREKNSAKWQALIPFVLSVTSTSFIESWYMQNGMESCVLLKDISEKGKMISFSMTFSIFKNNMSPKIYRSFFFTTAQ
jgi:hypothetical protein